MRDEESEKTTGYQGIECRWIDENKNKNLKN